MFNIKRLLTAGLLCLNIAAAKAAADSCQRVGGFHVTAVSPNEAILYWDAVPGVSGYQYVISKNGTPPDKYGVFTKQNALREKGLGANGTYYAHVRSSCGAKTSPWLTVQFNTPAPKSLISFEDNSFAVQVYPLQADRSLTVKVKGGDEQASVWLYNALGILLHEYSLIGDRLHIEVGSLPKGIYYMRYCDEAGRLQMLRFTRF